MAVRLLALVTALGLAAVLPAPTLNIPPPPLEGVEAPNVGAPNAGEPAKDSTINKYASYNRNCEFISSDYNYKFSRLICDKQLHWSEQVSYVIHKTAVHN